MRPGRQCGCMRRRAHDILALVSETGSWLESQAAFTELAMRRLRDLQGSDEAHFNEVGPSRGGAPPPPFHRRILDDPERYDPDYRGTMRRFARRRPIYSCITTDDYS